MVQAIPIVHRLVRSSCRPRALNALNIFAFSALSLQHAYYIVLQLYSPQCFIFRRQMQPRCQFSKLYPSRSILDWLAFQTIHD